MSNRELSTQEHGVVVILCLVGVLLIMAFCVGCTTARNHMYIGQAMDVATTYYALEIDGGFVEGNDLLGDIEGVIIGKIVVIGIAETLAWLDPKNKSLYYKIMAVGGYAPAAWNTYQLSSE